MILREVARLDYTGPTIDSAESSQSGMAVPARMAQAFGDRLGPAVSFATTEQFLTLTLQRSG